MKKTVSEDEVMSLRSELPMDVSQLLKQGFTEKDISIFLEIMRIEKELIGSSTLEHHLKESLKETSKGNSKVFDVDKINQVEAGLLEKCSNNEVKFRIAGSIVKGRSEVLMPQSIMLAMAIDQLGEIGSQSNDPAILNETVQCLKKSMIINLRDIPLNLASTEKGGIAALKTLYTVGCLNKLAAIYNMLGDTAYVIEVNKEILTLSSRYLLTQDMQAIDIAKKVLGHYAPDFFKSSSHYSLIIPTSTFKVYENEFLVKARIQSKILNPVQEKTKKGVWTEKILFSDYGVKGYIDEEFISKTLGSLNSTANVEIAKMLCLEAICLATLNSRDNTCLNGFIKHYPGIVSKAIRQHSEYFFDGSLITLAEKHLVKESESEKDNGKIFEGTFIDLTYSIADQSHLIGENNTD